MKVLVTGGAGYIGSHTLVELLKSGHEPLVVDSFVNSSPEVLSRVRSLAAGPLSHEKADIRDTATLANIAQAFRPEAVIHFAGLKAVGESQKRPVDYYDVNVTGTLSLLRAMDAALCRKIIFSSSATVYGDPVYLPYDENHPLNPTSVYGRTKRIAEQIIGDWSVSTSNSSALMLRYFNPAGAHSSGCIGEDPVGVPQNLMPFLAQVATGRQTELCIFGDDYPTHDGTGIRDYIHVVDLAQAHVAALSRLAIEGGFEVFNIGTGRGYSVKEMHSAFSRAVGRDLPYKIMGRRDGDIAEMQANCDKAASILGWRAECGLDDMAQSLWSWNSKHPNGYNQLV